MKFTLNKIVNDAAGLAEICKKNWPSPVSYIISKNVTKFEAELAIYNAERTKLVNKYSVKDETGMPIISENNQVTLTDPDGWSKDIQELLAIEIDIEIETFSIKSLKEGYTTTPAEMILIDYMIVD